MDYLDVSRCLIYRDRSDLNEFGVRTPDTLNNVLFKLLKELPLMHVEGAKKYALECFNNAYYICTVILTEEFPELRIADYEKKLLETSGQYRYDVCSASMAMVCHLLYAYDKSYDFDSDLQKNIYQNFNRGKWIGIVANKNFYQMANNFEDILFTLSPDAFARRDIIEAIENVSVDILINNSYYVNELLSLEKDPLRLQYGLDLATNRVNNYLNNFEFLPPEDVDIDFSPSSIDIAHGAIDFYKERKSLAMKMDEDFHATDDYTSSQAEIEKLQYQGDIRPLQARITELEKQIVVLQEAKNNDPEYIESLNRQLSEEKDKNAQLEEEVKQLREVMKLDTKLESDSKRLQIDERIILISTALGTPWNSDLTNQTQIAKIIEHFSGDGWRSIRSRIVAINSEMKQEIAKPGKGLSQGTKEAINNVIGWLSKATRGERNTQTTDALINEIKDVFLNTKE